MSKPVAHVVIAGGGTAGWLAAAMLGAWSKKRGGAPLSITLVEAPDIPTIGVGEGTWPTIRETLASIGIDEAEFLTACDASFKQGSRFEGWRTGLPGDRYDHPFTPPPVAEASELVGAWQTAASHQPFARAVSAQPGVCDASLAPRQRSMPAFAGALNYAYHLDAGKLVQLLRRHAVDRLGVTHVQARIGSVDDDADGGIAALQLSDGRTIEGDLFLDCTGLAALLIGGHCRAGWINQSHVLANDRALAAQVDTGAGDPIASQTIGTAHEAGWLWDIALPTRRGIGCVYSSRFVDDDRARAILDHYIAKNVPSPRDYSVRKIEFPTGYRDRFWVGNCLALGLSAGFIEPLEASAIVLIELSLRALMESFPSRRDGMPFLARRFNEQLTSRWQRIIEFLKLHYVLSERQEPYWRTQREVSTIPERLTGLLKLWTDQPPSSADLPLANEMFPPASYQYVFYGMGGPVPSTLSPPTPELVEKLLRSAERERALAAALPTNRSYLDALTATVQQESAA